MRDALPKLGGELKVGVIGSLGVRRRRGERAVTGGLAGRRRRGGRPSAALALGAIRDPEAAKVLLAAKTQSAEAANAATDASLACAEGLLATGKEVRSAGDLQTVRRRGSAQARSPGGDARHAGVRRQEGLKRDLVLCQFLICEIRTPVRRTSKSADWQPIPTPRGRGVLPHY